MKEYRPINCDYYDLIEHYATLRKVIRIVYLDGEGRRQETDDRIVNTHARNGEEFFSTERGLFIRLDRIVSLDGKPLPDAC